MLTKSDLREIILLVKSKESDLKNALNYEIRKKSEGEKLLSQDYIITEYTKKIKILNEIYEKLKEMYIG